ncbi:MAG TPA: hypothetical protein VJ326_09530 [Thermoplasmata archaeon]|nr:hypothetical protein [Thermoplasmata archaeon]
MRKSGPLALASITLGALSIRWLPLLSFLTWGADIGEYYAVLRDLAATGHVSTAYAGWGVTYPYFPGLFFAQDALAVLSPLDVPTVVSLLAPALGALAVLPVFLLGATITRETKVGLFAAAFVAVAMPHVYSTSHTAPSTLGDLLVFAGLLAFHRAARDRRAVVPTLAIAGALIVTHHLSAYFFMIMAVLAVVLRGFLRASPDGGMRRQVAILVAILAGTFAYWLGYATTFRDGILRDVNVSPWWIIPAAFPVLLGLLALGVRLRRRSAWRYRPVYPELPRAVRLYAATLAFLFGVMAYAIFAAAPGTAMPLPATILIYFAPLCALIALASAGRKFFDFLRGGDAAGGWLGALVLSTLFGAVAAPHVIIPYRHTEYLIVPIAIFAGLALARLLDLAGAGPGARARATAAVGIVLLANVLTALPPPEVIVGWQEGGRAAALDAAYWSRDHVDGLLAADHRASTLAFGFGRVDATWDATRTPFLAGTFEEARDGLLGILAPSGVADASYVWVDRDTEAGVQLFPWEPAHPMSAPAKSKFGESPFIKVFDNGYARAYWIAWGCEAPSATC